LTFLFTDKKQRYGGLQLQGTVVISTKNKVKNYQLTIFWEEVEEGLRPQYCFNVTLLTDKDVRLYQGNVLYCQEKS